LRVFHKIKIDHNTMMKKNKIKNLYLND